MSADCPLIVLHVDDGREFRGGQQQVTFLAREQALAGHHPVVLCPSGAPLADRIRQEGGVCRQARLAGELSPAAIRTVRQAVAELHPDVVHAHTSHAHTLMLLAVRGGPRPLRVVSRRLNATPGRSPWAGWKYGRRVDFFLAVSRAVGHALAAGGIEPDRIRVVHSTVDPARFAAPVPRHEALRALGLPAGSRVIGALGSLVPQKAHDDLLRAFARLAPAHPDVRLVILGDGPLRPDLERLTADLGLGGRVFLPGFRADLGALLPHFSAVAMPSLWEGLPNAVLDALAAGVPVVATPAGGTAEVIGRGVGGLLVPFGSPRALAAAIDRLLRQPEEADRLASRGRARVLSEFIPPVMARRTEDAYREGLARLTRAAPASVLEARGPARAWSMHDAVRRDLLARAGGGRLPPIAAGGVSGGRGRGPVLVESLGGRPAVVKVHRHGGLPGRLLSWFGADAQASWLSDRRLRRLARVSRGFRARGGDGDEILGWLATRRGLLLNLYSASALLADSIPLEAELRQAGRLERARLMTALGRSLARWHHAGLRHRDLNLGNVLVGATAVTPSSAGPALTVIDLDGARLVRTPRTSAGAAGLARLERSARKLGGAVTLTKRERQRQAIAYGRERARLAGRPDSDADRSARRLLAAWTRRRLLFPMHCRGGTTVSRGEANAPPSPPPRR